MPERPGQLSLGSSDLAPCHMPRLHTHLKHGFAVTLVRCSLGVPPLVSASVFLLDTRAHGLLGWPSPLLSVPRWPLARPSSAWEIPGPWLQWSPGAPLLLSKRDPMTTAHTRPAKAPSTWGWNPSHLQPLQGLQHPTPPPCQPRPPFSFLSCHPWCVPRAGSVSHRLDHHLHFVCVLRQMFHPSVLSGRVFSARAPRAPVDCACGELPPAFTNLSVRPSVRPQVLLHPPPSHGFLAQRHHSLTASVVPILSASPS